LIRDPIIKANSVHVKDRTFCKVREREKVSGREVWDVWV
jgi:hypothetical protein